MGLMWDVLPKRLVWIPVYESKRMCSPWLSSGQVAIVELLKIEPGHKSLIRSRKENELVRPAR